MSDDQTERVETAFSQLEQDPTQLSTFMSTWRENQLQALNQIGLSPSDFGAFQNYLQQIDPTRIMGFWLSVECTPDHEAERVELEDFYQEVITQPLHVPSLDPLVSDPDGPTITSSDEAPLYERPPDFSHDPDGPTITSSDESPPRVQLPDPRLPNLSSESPRHPLKEDDN